MIKPTPIHQSRNKQDYYIHQRTTKTGKLTYYLSTKDTGDIVQKLPKGYEIYDHPETNRPFIRLIPPKIITDKELELTKNCMAEFSDVKHYRIDIKKKSILIYIAEEPNPTAQLPNFFNIPANPELDAFVNRLRELIPDIPKEIDESYLLFSPMLRFTIVDEEKRVFHTERWCFRGSLDGWITLFEEDSLEKLCKTFFPHLNKESFYELPY